MKRLIILAMLAVLAAVVAGCGSGDDLVGLWESVDSSQVTAEFRSDGSAALQGPGLDMDLDWSIDDGKLCMVDPGDEPRPSDCADYTLDGDRLIIRMGEESLRLERWIGE